MFDVVSFLEDNLIDFSLPGTKNVQDGWIGIKCPLCDDQSNHGGFNLDAGYYTCWRCGWHPIKKVVIALGFPPEVIQTYDVALAKTPGKATESHRPLFISMPPGSKPLRKVHRKYLRGRGFNPDLLVEKFKLQGTGPLGEYSHRIVAPIFFNKIFVSYQCRDYTGKARLRYKPCRKKNELVHHKDILYNLDTVTDTALVVEGITDVWRIGDGCVATFGTAYTTSQVYLLAERCNRVFILYDPGRFAQKKAKSLATELSTIGVEVKIITLKVAGDPASALSPKRVRRLRREIGL